MGSQNGPGARRPLSHRDTVKRFTVSRLASVHRTEARRVCDHPRASRSSRIKAPKAAASPDTAYSP